MPYPNIEGKHGFNAAYSPSDSLAYRRNLENQNLPSPDGIILTYQISMAEHMLSRKDGLRHRFITEGLYPLNNKDKNVGIYLCGFGASHAALIMEELIARGATKFINIGVAGSLQKNVGIGSIVVCNEAIRDEGVSHHYLAPGKDVLTSVGLTKRLKGALSKHGLSFALGKTWTTDAPFRETEEELRQYQEEGVLTVEMETAALAAIAQHRGVEFAAAFVISDSLAGGVWKPGFESEELIEALKKLHEASLDVF